MTETILRVEKLRKQFPGFLLNDVSFSLPTGYVMGFIGPNGAGKTTTIKSILGLVLPDSGSVELFGAEKSDADQSCKQQLGVVMDLPFYADDWTALDAQRALRPFYSRWDEPAFRSLLKQFSIDTGKKVKELSRGMKVKLMVAVALSHDARLLILDEPTSGLDPVARDELLDILRDYMCREDRGVLFSTHITSDLEKIADYITYINDGHILYSGERDALLERYRLVKGGLGDLTAEQKRGVIGLREHMAGFEGLVESAALKTLGANIINEPVTLEEIVIFFNKEGANNG